MQKQALQEIIEQYLDDALSPGERQAFEKRLKEDPALRQELELQRQLQHDFDGERLQLRANLQKIMAAPLQPRSAVPWWLWLLGLFGILMLGWNFWPRQAPIHVEPTALPPADAPKAPTRAPVPPIPNPESQPDYRPMAMNDPADFKPNPGMEAFVNSNIRSEVIDVKLSSPRNGLEIKPDKKGLSNIRFAGIAIAQSGMQPKGFIISFFDNRDANNPLFAMPLPVQDVVEGRLEFDLWQQLQFKPGLYYFTVEAEDAGALLYAGKFFVRQ